MGLTAIIRTQGLFQDMGEVKFFAGREHSVPRDYHIADGSILSISQNQALFSLLGTTYGGDGRTTFALPDLRGRAVVGASGFGDQGMGRRSGAPTLTLSEANLPSHSHTTVDVDTSSTGSGAPIDHGQPTLALSYEIVTQGVYPSRSGGSTPAPNETMGFVTMDAALDEGPDLDRGTVEAIGQLTPITDNTALFSLIGTNFGGDGRSTFAMPDTEERMVIGAAAGLPFGEVGRQTGAQTVTLTEADMPSHSHTDPDAGGVTGAAGGIGSFNNVDPSLVMNYLIATEGLFPSSGSASSEFAPFLGEIAIFAGNFVPSGWMQAAGQLLPIVHHQALFSLLGTTYGGDGRETFALPNLAGRTAIGTGETFGPLGSVRLGQILGDEFASFDVSQMAVHDHDITREIAPAVPLPAAAWLLIAGLGGIGGLRAARRSKAAQT
ncbi:hypothetical protein NBRC116596_21100 [Litorivita sp. NS0012-18]